MRKIDEMLIFTAVTDSVCRNKIIKQYSIFGGVYAVLQFMRGNRVYHKEWGYPVFYQWQISGTGCIDFACQSARRHLQFAGRCKIMYPDVWAMSADVHTGASAYAAGSGKT